jgi:hypothetical protein
MLLLIEAHDLKIAEEAAWGALQKAIKGFAREIVGGC